MYVILRALEKIISDYYGCETTVCYQDQKYYITLSDDAHEKVELTNTITFGQWPQNGAEPEPLEWILLDDTGLEMLLLFYPVAFDEYQKDLIASTGFCYRKNKWNCI